MQKAIRVCTLNVGMPQVCVFGRRLEPVPSVNERLALLPDFIRSLRADVVFLQELFHARHRQTLMDRLGEVYPHAAFHDDAGALSLSNGLLCLSRFPLVDARFTPFADRCWEERLFVSKGFQDFGIQVGRDVIKVAHTHLTAGGFFSHPEQKKYDAIRANQIRQMLQQFSLSELGLVVGDFNTGPEVSVTNYRQLTTDLRDVFQCTAQRSGSSITWDPENRLNVDGPHKMCPPQRIDLLLCTDAFQKKYTVSSYRTHGQELPIPVSDHWAVATDFAFDLAKTPLRMTFLRGFVFGCRNRSRQKCLFVLVFDGTLGGKHMKDIYSKRRLRFFGTTVDQGNFAPPFTPASPEIQDAYADSLRQLIFQKVGFSVEALSMARLCHGTHIELFRTPRQDAIYLQTDGMVTGAPRTALVVTGADCPPVLLYDAQKNVIGLAHSGREGTRQNIVLALMQKMQTQFGCVPEELQAAIGPGICQDHYQVTMEMAEAFKPFGFDSWIVRGGHGYLDLRKAIFNQLLQLGVARDHITVSPDCTYEAEGVWHSFRRDKERRILTKEDRPQTSAFIALMV